MKRPNKIIAFLQSKIGSDSKDSISPLMRWMNPTLRHAEEGSLVFEHLVREEMANPLHILHGGITAAIIDDAIGATIYSLDNTNAYTTINLNIDYFSPARVGDIIIAETQMVKKGDRIMNAECTVWNEHKTRKIAKGQSNLIKTHIEI